MRDIDCQDERGENYRGQHSSTMYGAWNPNGAKEDNCLNWDDNPGGELPEDFGSKSWEGKKNLCRNPSWSPSKYNDGAWCYVDRKFSIDSIEMCDIRRCQDCDVGNCRTPVLLVLYQGPTRSC